MSSASLGSTGATELSYAAGETTPPLLEETIGANLERTVAAHPDREALVEVASGRRWTWSELDRDVDDVARGLMALGIAKGDRVGIWAPNCAEWTLVQYATAKIGAILVNVNPAYRTHEFSYVVDQSGLRLLLSASGFRSSDYRAMVEETRGECRSLERVVYEELCAWVKIRAGGEPLDAEKIRDFATGKLSHYKIPRYVLVVEEFPMTVTGKIRKVQMREESVARLGLDRQ